MAFRDITGKNFPPPVLSSSNWWETMRIIGRIPEADMQKEQELITGRWVKLKEPGNSLTAILESLPIMALNAAVTLFIAGVFVPVSFGYFGIGGSSFSFQIDLPALAGGIVGILIAHELIHLLCIPGFFRSDTTSLGITYGGGFVYTEEQLTRGRYLIISFAPFILLSIVLPFILGLLNLLSPVIIGFLVLNSLGSSVDILIALQVLHQVPSRAYLVANGKDSYWKPDN
jgi:hypothetical protein